MELSKNDYEISASITDYSYGSFNGLMTIVNRSDYDIEDWSVKIDSLRLLLNSSGIEIQLDRLDFYTADMKFTENGVLLLENRGFNSSIAAGNSLSLGFSGNCADKGNAGKDSMTLLLENAKLYDIRIVESDTENNPAVTEAPTQIPTEIPTITDTPEVTDIPVITDTPEITGVPAQEDEKLSDSFALMDDISSLTIGYSEGDTRVYVSSDISLPQKGENGSVITWKSSNPELIDKDGRVTRPAGNEFVEVCLTATVEIGEIKDEREYTVFVVPEPVGIQEKTNYEELKELNEGELPKIQRNIVRDIRGTDYS